MTHVKDKQLADKLVEDLRAILNRAFIYLQTHKTPDPASAETKRNLNTMKLYKKLPRADCKVCGEQSCLAFATKLFLGEKLPQDCLALTYPNNSELKNNLQKMLAPIKL